jgi:membrane protein implicated in regulation of membrane protease activity
MPWVIWVPNLVVPVVCRLWPPLTRGLVISLFNHFDCVEDPPIIVVFVVLFVFIAATATGIASAAAADAAAAPAMVRPATVVGFLVMMMPLMMAVSFVVVVAILFVYAIVRYTRGATRARQGRKLGHALTGSAAAVVRGDLGPRAA